MENGEHAAYARIAECADGRDCHCFHCRAPPVAAIRPSVRTDKDRPEPTGITLQPTGASQPVATTSSDRQPPASTSSSIQATTSHTAATNSSNNNWDEAHVPVQFIEPDTIRNNINQDFERHEQMRNQVRQEIVNELQNEINDLTSRLYYQAPEGVGLPAIFPPRRRLRYNPYNRESVLEQVVRERGWENNFPARRRVQQQTPTLPNSSDIVPTPVEDSSSGEELPVYHF